MRIEVSNDDSMTMWTALTVLCVATVGSHGFVVTRTMNNLLTLCSQDESRSRFATVHECLQSFYDANHVDEVVVFR